jgi:hypothetical protein
LEGHLRGVGLHLVPREADGRRRPWLDGAELNEELRPRILEQGDVGNRSTAL